jgi:hypothetical protein
MDIPGDETNRQLFNAGLDGANMVPRLFFWHSAWLDGASPKDIAPAIFFSKQKEEQNSTTGVAGQFMGAGHKHSSNQHGSAVDTPQFEHS